MAIRRTRGHAGRTRAACRRHHLGRTAAAGGCAGRTDRRELELLDLLDGGALLVDSRTSGSFGGRTIPGAVNIPHDQTVARQAELTRDELNVLFCNGPQCPQSPDAIRQLIADGFPADALAYYRGGMHDWVTLALPTKDL